MGTESAAFAEILNNCLEAIERGEATVEACLRQYPEHQAQLRPLLAVAGRLTELHTVQPSPAFRSQAAARLQARLASSSRPPQSGNGPGSGPTSGRGGPSSEMGKLGFLLVSLSLLTGLVISSPRPEGLGTEFLTDEPPLTVQVEQPVNEVESPDTILTGQPQPPSDTDTDQGARPLEENDLLILPNRAAPLADVGDPGSDDSGGQPVDDEIGVDDDGHSNYVDGVDLSNPGSGGSEPNGQDDPVGTAGDEGATDDDTGNNVDGVDLSNPGSDGSEPDGQDDPSGTADDVGGIGDNGHGNNLDGVDLSNPGSGSGGPNGVDDPSGTVDDEGGSGSSNSSSDSGSGNSSGGSGGGSSGGSGGGSSNNRDNGSSGKNK